MVFAVVNGHLQVVSALLDTFFPALAQEAEAARVAGKHAEAAFLDTPGSKDPRVAQLVGCMAFRLADINCHVQPVPRLDYVYTPKTAPIALQVLEAVDELPPETQRKLRL